jgi:uncharacterized protein
MKKSITTTLFVAIAGLCMAQSPQAIITPNPFPKTITVSGSASMEVVPDEIYVNIELREYQKKGESKKDIETIKNQFLESCKAIGIADDAISIASYSGFNNYFFIRKKKKNPDMFASITYQVKFSSSKLMDGLIEKLDDDATQNFLIASVSHSKITEFRKQLKIKAVQAAKDKGIYLTEGIGEKLGEAITINEPQDYVATDNNAQFNFAAANGKILRDGMADKFDAQEVDFKKMKLRFEVSVVFAIK